jgi:cytochrome c-type biogenesis protein CcmH/NrfF
MKALQVGSAGIAVCFSLGATDAGSRYTNLNHRLMCTCGCAQILGECNHVGCPNSTGELDELRTALHNGKSDQQILDSFVAKYGAVVLAAPTTTASTWWRGLRRSPSFAAATLGTILLVRRWSVADGAGRYAWMRDTMDPEERERREQIRRDTGDGGF